MENRKRHRALGLLPQWLSPRLKQGTISPPSPVRLCWSIPADRRRLTREGGVGEELWNTGNQWVVVGCKGSHHSGLASVRENDGGGRR
jgi:hypothetical protein